MKCDNSSLLDGLISKYPRILYSIRAFTHALAYFNSCLNPYLYAAMNRHFRIDLADILPSWVSPCEHLKRSKNSRYHHGRKLSSPKFLSHQTLEEKYDFDYHEQSPTIMDVSCPVELQEIKYN